MQCTDWASEVGLSSHGGSMYIGSKWVINNADGARYGRAYGKRGCNSPLYVKLARQGRVSYRVHSKLSSRTS